MTPIIYSPSKFPYAGKSRKKELPQLLSILGVKINWMEDKSGVMNAAPTDFGNGAGIELIYDVKNYGLRVIVLY